MYGTFAQLVTISAIARLLFSATTCLAVPVLRRKMPNAARAFKIPGGLIIPALAAVISIWLLTGINKSQMIAGGAALTFEAIHRRLEDRGGGLARVNRRPRVVEGLALPREEDEFRLRFYNSLTTWIEFTLRPRDLFDNTPLYP